MTGLAGVTLSDALLVLSAVELVRIVLAIINASLEDGAV